MSKQRTQKQLPGQKKIGIYYAQSKETMEKSFKVNVDSDSDESEELKLLEDALANELASHKRKKRESDPLTKKVAKIKKTFDSNISFANSEEEASENNKVSSDLISPEKKLNMTLKGNDECETASEISTIKDSGIDTQATDLMDGFDDFFDEEWSYKKESDTLDDFFQDDWSYGSTPSIDFKTPKRCIIIDIIWDKNDMTLTVKDLNTDISDTVKCFGIWRYTKIEPGEPIVIKAIKESSEDKHWTVDNNNGWIINQPDTLVSGTSVVGALWCNRQSVFQEKFRQVESLPFKGVGNTFMLTGSLTHELIQTVLDRKITEIKKITELLDEIMKSRHAIEMMYSVGISSGDCKNLMKPSVPQIYNFVKRYVLGIAPEMVDQNYNGKIDMICDIEENVWLPSLGLKGKIDLTVKVRDNVKNPNSNSKETRIIPLEIKTGKTSFSTQHQGQLILYTMMMNMTGREANSGLLLYLRENIMREIVGSPNAHRDLITLRNTVAYYSTRQPTITKVNDQDRVEPMEFPKPINHPACAKCPYNILCCAYLNEEDKNEMQDNSTIKNISQEITSHLSQEHIDYVSKWVSLLQIEETTGNEDVATWKNVWTLEPSKREKKGSCIGNLSLVSVSDKYGRFLHVFEKSKEFDQSLIINQIDFTEQEYVIISTSNRVNICSGFVDNINALTVAVHCDKDITKVYKDKVFHIDKGASSSLLVQNMSQLGGLLEDHEICTKLRKIVIDRFPGTFKTETPSNIMEIGVDIFSKLNEDQINAILKTLTADDYVLIKGFPGTGKTQTLVAMVDLLIKLDKSVLISAHTNSAIDNILLKLLERKIDFIRFGSVSKTHPSLRHMVDENVTAHCDSPESLHTLYSSKKVVAVTCYGATHAHLSKRKFDYCIIDESTQVLQPTILRPLYSASKFVLVGDPEQLPPIAKSATARKLGLNESLFSRLLSENNFAALALQYRMNNCIMDVANKLTYQDQLKMGNYEIGHATLPITKISNFESYEKWIRKALSLRLRNSVLFLNTSSTHDLNLNPLLAVKKQGASNYWEAAIIKRLIDVLKNLGINEQTIGVIAPYRAQVRLLRSILATDIEVNTVDQYQGRDKSIILYSCSKSISSNTDIAEFNILEDKQRLTVAVTRAKHKLILVGDLGTLERFTPFKKLITILKSQNQIFHLKDGENDFFFDELISSLLL